MDLGLNDRVALVAAASQGIGYATALELAKEGTRVFLCSRDEKRASEAAQQIHDATGGKQNADAGSGAMAHRKNLFAKNSQQRQDAATHTPSGFD